MKTGLWMMAAAAGLACPAFAQDSVSINPGGGNGLPGDGLQYNVAGAPYQKARYVVDLVPLYTSCGTKFGMGPIFKSSKSSAGFFGSLVTAQAMSQTVVNNVPGGGEMYAGWNQAGQGVHPVNNANPGFFPLTGPVSQFGAGFAEFATNDGGQSYGGIIGGRVRFDPSDPARLYVTRTQAAMNLNVPVGDGPRSALGFGAVDAAGNLTFRGDGNGATGANALVGNNYFRVTTDSYGAFLGRSPAIFNTIDNAGGSDAVATDWPLRNSTVTHNTPSCLAADLTAGGRGRVTGSNFNREYTWETGAAAMSVTTTHRPGTTDHRGGVNVSSRTPLGGVATGGMLTLSTGGAGTDSISVWAIDNTGAVIGGAQARTFTRPAALIDNCTGFNWGGGNFDHYRDQVAFRGGNGQVAIGADTDGNGLAAAVVYNSGLGGNDNPWNAIAAVRWNGPNSQWNLVAWTNPPAVGTAAEGKALMGDYGADGIAFTDDAGEFDGVCDALDAPIGRLAPLFQIPGAPFGPSISAPAFDAYGNCYFMACAGLNKIDQQGVPFIDYDTCLIRGVYDKANFCWNLELMLELGDTFVGANSSTRYQIRFLEVSDGNSVSSGGFWSGNVNQTTWDNRPLPTCTPANVPQWLGGLVFSTKIVYDVDGDNDFDDPTSAGGDVNSRDEAYNVLMYVGNTSPAICPADFDGDGFITGIDYDLYVAAFEAGEPTADFDCDGFITGIDFDLYVGAFEAGC